jgi:tRNA threonylcarbamoyladenosine biosynthesis protein TsaE
VNGRTTVHTSSEQETAGVGRDLAARLAPGDIVLLEGDLAAGKTAVVRGLVAGLEGPPEQVSSPTFVLLQTYDCSRHGVDRLHHVDLYRLGESLPELRELGIEEIFSDPEAVTAVEWPKGTLATWVPAGARVWRIVIIVESDDSRSLVVDPPD